MGCEGPPGGKTRGSASSSGAFLLRQPAVIFFFAYGQTVPIVPSFQPNAISFPICFVLSVLGGAGYRVENLKWAVVRYFRL